MLAAAFKIYGEPYSNYGFCLCSLDEHQTTILYEPYFYVFQDHCMYVCLFVCLSVCMHACVYACEYACDVYACDVYACVYVRTYVRMYACMHVKVAI